MRMKKGVLLIYIIILFYSLYYLSASEHSTVRGDVNGDGVIDMVDALLIAQYAGEINPDNFNPAAADINNNSKNDDEDALLVAQYALGIISDLEDIDKALSSINLVPNPGFEDGTEGWHNFCASCRLTASDAKAHSGKYSGYITNRTETWNGPGLNIMSIIENGRAYNISVRAVLENEESATLQVTIKKTDEAGDNYANIASERVINSEWTKIAGTYTLKVSGSLKELVLYVENAPPDVTFYIDDVMIIDVVGGKRSLKTPTPKPTPVYTPTPIPTPTQALKGDERTYLNPILSGFYPDPSICRAGNDYYLVASSFSYYPGLPIFHSKDLVHWRQIGHVLDRPSQLNLDRLPLSYGLFAPAIHYNNGSFYITNTLVGRGDNFIVTAKKPEGPWSEPYWIRKARGIDPSLFFDDDGKTYWVSNGNPPSPRYNGHKVIWMQEIDIQHMELIPETYHILVNAGSNPADNPIWIEAPHLYKVNGCYYLIAAEGGTAEDHSEVIFRSKTITGPYESFGGNPILTQRHLDRSRINAITCTGHADMVETQNGEWWAVFLGCRPYEPFQKNHYNTGRETFLAPVHWIDGWPIINPEFELIQYSYLAPNLPEHKWKNTIAAGNFTMREDFDSKKLPFYWIFLRTPREEWYSLTERKGYLRMNLRPSQITLKENPSFIGRRQQHAYFTAETSMVFTPKAENETAGIVAFQNEINFYYMGLTLSNGTEKICLEQGAKQGIAYAGIPREVTAKVAAKKDHFLYKSERYGNIKYAIPVPANETYTIIFRMAELYQTGPGKRSFNILVEGKAIVSEFDIFKKAGASYTAHDMSFSVFTEDQSLDIEFQSIVDNASICAIRIEDKTGRLVAAMNCGGPEYTSDDDTRYVSDKIYLSKKEMSDNTMTIAEATLTNRDVNKPLYLKIKGAGKIIGFYYSEDRKKWNVLRENVDNTYLSTKTAGGFVGVVIGLYVSSQGKPGSNVADFDWFEYTGDDPVYKITN